MRRVGGRPLLSRSPRSGSALLGERGDVAVADEAVAVSPMSMALGWVESALERERPGDPGLIAVRDFLRSLGSRPAV